MTSVKRTTWKKALKNSLPVCMLTSATFFLLGPAMLYFSNISEFEFGLTDVLPMMLIAWAICFAVLMILCLLIKNKKARIIIRACILGIGIGFFVQNAFMSEGYGQLNGQEIEWTSMTGKGIINTLVWIACIVVPIIATLRAKKNKARLQNVFAGVLLAIQVISCITIGGIEMSSREPGDEYTITNEGAFTLSDKKNIVFFLLDDFGSKLFEEIAAEDTSYSDTFSGFTYFPDTVGIGCTTKGSLPFILTGKWNENAKPYGRYLNDGYDNELYKTLDQKGYDTRLYIEKIYMGSKRTQYFDNTVEESERIDKKKTIQLLYKLTAFTYMPHYLKPAFWLYSGDFAYAAQNPDSGPILAPDPWFYWSMNKCGITVDTTYEGAYRFYYMNGPHKPYRMDENAEEVESGSVTRKQTAKGCLKIVAEYAEKLKEKGIFDNTMIVVLADHGNWEDQSAVFNPLLLVKPINAKNERMQVSKAQITYEDLMPTVLETITETDAGKTFFEIGENEQRERRFLYYRWDGDWESDYLPELHEFVIRGDVRNVASRQATGRVYTSKGLITNDVEYHLGSTVKYTTADAGINNYVNYGLFYPEPTHTFAQEKTEWFFPFKEYSGEDLRFDISVYGVQNGHQRVGVWVNEQMVYETEARERGILSLDIPSDLITDKSVRILLEFPDANSSEGDDRVRSLAINAVELNYADENPFDQW